ncbi:MAG: hemerythrin domain-containing protein [Clostridium sp.]|nr:hemerythrin domain-containing protein [Clostridium sp.]
MKPYRSPYTADDRFFDLVDNDFDILPIVSRFSIPLGFGNRTIGQVCRENGLSTDLFLLVVNFIITGEIDDDTASRLDPIPLVEFLRNSHEYFLSYKFPHIRGNLAGALDPAHTEINPAILRYFDDYVAEVVSHFRHEEETLFPYIAGLAARNPGNTAPGNYNIKTFRLHHHEIDSKLSDLKNVILKFYTTSMRDRMYDAVVDIYNCEADIRNHADIENRILVPLIERLEAERTGETKEDRQ